MTEADFLIIGGGIAGLSAAARLSKHGRAIILEGEDALGYHSSGRSVTFSHYGIGDEVVRGLTSYSRSFFENPPDGFCEVPVAVPHSILYVGTEAMLPQLDILHADISRFTNTMSRVNRKEIETLCPISGETLVAGLFDPSGLRLDADALLQSFARQVRKNGGAVLTGKRAARIHRQGKIWQVRTEAGEEFSAPVLVNAAGAWADHIANLAGVRPLGLQPMRRTIIVLDPPNMIDVRNWPFMVSAARDFYMLADAGRLLASPVDELPSDPCDAWPEEYDIALAAAKVEEYTTLKITRIAHRWAGLRSFVADRVPTAGYAPDAPGFFWLAGQGGYGLQTAPAMARIVESLILDLDWPSDIQAAGVTLDKILPDRLFTRN